MNASCDIFYNTVNEILLQFRTIITKLIEGAMKFLKAFLIDLKFINCQSFSTYRNVEILNVESSLCDK